MQLFYGNFYQLVFYFTNYKNNVIISAEKEEVV